MVGDTAPELTTADRLRVAATGGGSVTISAVSARKIATGLDALEGAAGVAEELLKQNDRLLVMVPAYFFLGVLVGTVGTLILSGVFS